mmetsp:Transcript_139605/g.253980  ORF Transcript_139605/g.253980 Transcript_139605/m.253980 type:complete len:358 (+) Transcript_139605:56-1129(+)
MVKSSSMQSQSLQVRSALNSELIASVRIQPHDTVLDVKRVVEKADLTPARFQKLIFADGSEAFDSQILASEETCQHVAELYLIRIPALPSLWHAMEKSLRCGRRWCPFCSRSGETPFRSLWFFDVRWCFQMSQTNAAKTTFFEDHGLLNGPVGLRYALRFADNLSHGGRWALLLAASFGDTDLCASLLNDARLNYFRHGTLCVNIAMGRHAYDVADMLIQDSRLQFCGKATELSPESVAQVHTDLRRNVTRMLPCQQRFSHPIDCTRPAVLRADQALCDLLLLPRSSRRMLVAGVTCGSEKKSMHMLRKLECKLRQLRSQNRRNARLHAKGASARRRRMGQGKHGFALRLEMEFDLN